jgi:hypothetical protein
MHRLRTSHKLRTLVLGGMMAAAVIGSSAGPVGAQNYYYSPCPAPPSNTTTTPYSYGYGYPYYGGCYGYSYYYPYYGGYYGYYG